VGVRLGRFVHFGIHLQTQNTLHQTLAHFYERSYYICDLNKKKPLWNKCIYLYVYAHEYVHNPLSTVQRWASMYNV